MLAALFLLATLIQLLFWGGLFPRLLYPAGGGRSGAPLPLFSVVICARNEAGNLNRHLPAVLGQQYPSFEVVVVDHASTDDTGTVLAAFSRQYPHLRTLRFDDPRPGKKRALALGIAAARHDWLVLTDADCRPASACWLHTLALHCISPVEVVLGYGPMERRAGLQNAFSRFETVMAAIQYGSFARAGLPYMGVGRNMALKKEALSAYDPFAHDDLISGDDDLAVNAIARAGNTSVAFDPAAFAWSEAPQGWRAFFRQKSRHVTTSMRYKPLHQVLLAVWALSFLGHYALGLLLLFGKGAPLAVAGYLIRQALAGSLFYTFAKRLAAADLRWKFPLLDALLALYYLLLTPALWWRKRQNWK